MEYTIPGEGKHQENDAGLRPVRSHDLRLTFASWLIGIREKLAYVRDRMGHQSIPVTVDTYGRLIPGANREAVARHATMVEKSATPREIQQLKGRAGEGGSFRNSSGYKGEYGGGGRD